MELNVSNVKSVTVVQLATYTFNSYSRYPEPNPSEVGLLSTLHL